MGKLTTHVLNLAAGIPAGGMRIELHEVDGGSPRLLAQDRTNEDGRCAKPLLEGTSLRGGRYTLTFHVAEYFRSIGTQLSDPPFIDDVVIPQERLESDDTGFPVERLAELHQQAKAAGVWAPRHRIP